MGNQEDDVSIETSWKSTADFWKRRAVLAESRIAKVRQVPIYKIRRHEMGEEMLVEYVVLHDVKAALK